MNKFKPLPAILFLFSTLLYTSCQKAAPVKDDADGRAEMMVARMTLDEKIGQMSQLFDGYFGDYEKFKQAIRDGRFGSLLNYLGADKVNEAQRIAVEESRLGIPLLIGRDVIHGYRTLEVWHGRLGLFPLEKQHAHQVQRTRVVGLPFDDAPADLLGPGEVARIVPCTRRSPIVLLHRFWEGRSRT